MILSFLYDIKSWWLKQSKYSNKDKSYLYTFTKQFQNYKQGCISQAFASQWARPKKIFPPDCLGLYIFKINKCEVNCNSTVISLPDSLWVLAYGCHGNLIILACSLHFLFVSLDFLIIQKTLLKTPPVSLPLPPFWLNPAFFIHLAWRNVYYFATNLLGWSCLLHLPENGDNEHTYWSSS